MQEKILIKGIISKTTQRIFLILGLLLSIGFVISYIIGFEILDATIDNAVARALSNFMLPLLCITIPVGLILIILYFYLSKMELTVSNIRVCGRSSFGKRVDLPLDKISAVGTSFLKGIDVGTSSGRIKFKLLKNQDEIHTIISTLLMERQQTKTSKTVPNNKDLNSVDELKKFKKLLDSGIITQDEFEQKKKQLLNL